MARIPLQPETRAARALSLTVTALMVGLGIIALAGTIGLRHVEQSWRTALADRWTVELPLTDAGEALPQADIERAVTALRATPGVAGARLIGPDEVGRLLQPWLGDGMPLADLPLPTLVDLTIDLVRPPTRDAVEQRIAPLVPGARIDDHGAWTRDLARLARTGETLGLALFSAVAAIMTLTIAAAARTRLAINRPEIELLHTIGASDGYIARQFQGGAFWLAVVGALVGSVAAAAAIAALLGAGGGFAPLVPRFDLGPLELAALATVPIAAILLATLVARATALILVSRLP